MWDWNLPANRVKVWDVLPHILLLSYRSSYPHWVHWCTVIDHIRRHNMQRTKITTQDEVEWRDCDLLQYTRTEKCNLFVLYNKNGSMVSIQMVYWRIGGGAWKKKNKSADVIWRDPSLLYSSRLLGAVLARHRKTTTLSRKRWSMYLVGSTESDVIVWYPKKIII